MAQHASGTGTYVQADLLWVLGSLSALHRRGFSADLVAREFPGECTPATLVRAARKLGFHIKAIRISAAKLAGLPLPLVVATTQQQLGLITAAANGEAVFFSAGTNTPQTLQHAELDACLTGEAWILAPEVEAANDADAAPAFAAGVTRKFGFSWFAPELMRHRKVWRDVLLASLALQIVALATPLFTQAIVDKVVVHRTQTTLIAIGLVMIIFIIFNAVLGWGRQYLVLHTGNRVDAVLGAAVWEHLLKLPPAYFHHRPTGVVAARLHAVENIREFVSGAAISMVLDLPFLLICMGVMLWYSVLLTGICVAILAVIAVASLIMAPIFQRQLNDQFLLGARNQAFVTEHIAGFETVKTLQMEPQLRQRYSGYLATYLASGFKTKQVGNTYNTFANAMEQAMTLLILVIGAWTVMNEPSFTIGMLVAFQMFAGKLSQPVLRIVGLWTQFQQASLSVKRLGDVMNAPVEPYSLVPQRQNDGQGKLEISGLGFRYAEDRPMLYSGLDLTLEPGHTVAIMGPSGTGKSTFAKLLLGFHPPTQGSIRIDDVDIRNLSANELRAWFGVVPQETVLFSGTILANLQAGNPNAPLDQVAQACRMAGIHEVIETLPQGYQTEIGERGVGLSGGQKQRLAIARALLKRPRILIFDEATSALDSETAEAFAKTVNQLKGKVTMLFITHALPKSLKIDSVLRIGQGGVHQFQLVPASVAP
ncbi:MAG: peptidase domain-containing ABC transporter [Burkholderiales bacterium]|nr:peptidase domain-containing ABC transporter [Burkholderiales bacterium]